MKAVNTPVTESLIAAGHPAAAPATAPAGPAADELRQVRGACPHDCPDTCALQVSVQAGRVVRVAGDPDHPPTHGKLCTKVSRYAERTYSPQRLTVPLRRVGAKGEGRFEPASWDEALGSIAGRLGAIAARDPQRILPYSYAGTMGIVQGDGLSARFFHALGASLLDRTICASAGATGLAYTLGASVGMDVERFVDARLILIWGSNPVASSLHFWGFAQEARRRGARLVAIDPYRSDSALKCDEHLALLPGTDGALALGLVHVLVRDGLVDRAYVDAHVIGFAALADRARDWTPERTGAVCGLDPARIEALARDYGRVKPAAIRLNYGMQRTRGGANAVRLVASLPALVGAWRDPAGGMLLSANGHFAVDLAAVQRPDLLPGGPGRRPRTINMSTIGDALLDSDPPVEALVVFNSNPVAVAPESEKVLRGFRREDLFTVVIDHFQTDTADHADWILPATTQLEHFDLHKSYGHRYWVINQPAIAPVGQSLPNSEIFRRLAARMGMTHPSLFESDEAVAAAAFRAGDPALPAGMRAGGRQALDWLAGRGWAKLELPDAPYAQGGFPTPSGKVEIWSERLAALGLDPLPDFVPPYESVQSNPVLASRYRLAMISPPARNFLNSSFVNVESLRAMEREPRVELHPDEAARRGLAQGERVRVFNDRGAFIARLHLTDRVRPGVLVGFGIWWHKLTPGGRNVNAVTGQALTDLGRAPTFYDCLVEVGADREDMTPA